MMEHPELYEASPQKATHLSGIQKQDLISLNCIADPSKPVGALASQWINMNLINTELRGVLH
ncbi:MAG: hypothetical protein R3B54_02195 [Bdellovibrionota bacterium]